MGLLDATALQLACPKFNTSMSQHHNVCILQTAGMRASIVAHENSQLVLRNAAGTGADTDVGTAALGEGLLLRLMLGLVPSGRDCC